MNKPENCSANEVMQPFKNGVPGRSILCFRQWHVNEASYIPFRVINDVGDASVRNKNLGSHAIFQDHESQTTRCVMTAYRIMSEILQRRCRCRAEYEGMIPLALKSC